MSTAATGSPSRSLGWIYGGVAALIWAAYQVLTHRGLGDGSGGGFTPLDLTLFRFGIPGLLLLPVLLRAGFPEIARLGYWRVAALTLAAGPALGLSTAQGYALAPLAHGAVLFPAFTTLAGVLLSRLVLGTPQTRSQLVGLGLIVAGLLLVGGVTSSDRKVLLGDSLFLISGLLWGLYTVMLRRWAINGLSGAAIAGAGSTIIAVLLYLAFGDLTRLLSLPAQTLWTQVIFQGLFAGVFAVVVYGHAVQRLGAATAALFPATVPVLALLLGVLAFDAVVESRQWLGLAATSLGLVLALGLLRPPRADTPSPRPSTSSP